MFQLLRDHLTIHRRLAVTGLTAVILIGAGGGIAVAATSSGAGRGGSGPTTATATPKAAIFTDACRLATVANNDPLLDPGQPGTSMRHDFFGNTAVTAASTAASLRGGPTDCSTSADASAYWTPVLSRDGVALTPSRALIYWRTPGVDAATTHTMPAGISMIAGDENATAPQPEVRWQCISAGKNGTGSATAKTPTPQSCTGGGQVRLVVDFPSCWDGHTLSGATQTNVVYPDGSSCPTTHPVRIPQIVFHETYPTSSADGLTLSMGPGMQGSTNTAHVDFVSGWNQTAFDRAMQTCVTGGKACGGVTGASATPAHPQDLVSPQRAARAGARKTSRATSGR